MNELVHLELVDFACSDTIESLAYVLEEQAELLLVTGSDDLSLGAPTGTLTGHV